MHDGSLCEVSGYVIISYSGINIDCLCGGRWEHLYTYVILYTNISYRNTLMRLCKTIDTVADGVTYVSS